MLVNVTLFQHKKVALSKIHIKGHQNLGAPWEWGFCLGLRVSTGVIPPLTPVHTTVSLITTIWTIRKAIT
jgi:hypothetical protein